LSLSGDTAYLEFENPEHATTAIEKYDNYKFEGSRILVEFALKTRNFHRGKPGRSDRERDMAAGRCFKCNEKGHIAKYCNNTYPKFNFKALGIVVVIVEAEVRIEKNIGGRARPARRPKATQALSPLPSAVQRGPFFYYIWK